MEKVIRYIREHHQQYRHELFELVRIPSVSTDPTHNEDVVTCAEALADHLASIGLQQVQIMSTERHPVVYAEWLGVPQAATILIYGHYDVQPPDPLELWDSP